MPTYPTPSPMTLAIWTLTSCVSFSCVTTFLYCTPHQNEMTPEEDNNKRIQLRSYYSKTDKPA